MDNVAVGRVLQCAALQRKERRAAIVSGRAARADALRESARRPGAHAGRLRSPPEGGRAGGVVREGSAVPAEEAGRSPWWRRGRSRLRPRRAEVSDERGQRTREKRRS